MRTLRQDDLPHLRRPEPAATVYRARTPIEKKQINAWMKLIRAILDHKPMGRADW